MRVWCMQHLSFTTPPILGSKILSLKASTVPPVRRWFLGMFRCKSRPRTYALVPSTAASASQQSPSQVIDTLVSDTANTSIRKGSVYCQHWRSDVTSGMTHGRLLSRTSANGRCSSCLLGTAAARLCVGACHSRIAVFPCRDVYGSCRDRGANKNRHAQASSWAFGRSGSLSLLVDGLDEKFREHEQRLPNGNEGIAVGCPK